MKKAIYPVLTVAIIVGFWSGYKTFKKGQYHEEDFLSDNQKRDIVDNHELQNVYQTRTTPLTKTNEFPSSLNRSFTKRGQLTTIDPHYIETVPRPFPQNTPTQYNAGLEVLFMRDFLDTKSQANPSLILDYSVSLRTKEDWLISFEIEGESLVKKYLSKITSRFKNDDMTTLEMQGACIRAIENSLDMILLETFYESAQIPSIDGELFSKKIESLPDNTLLISFTVKENKYEIRQNTHRFYVSPLTYQENQNKITTNFLEKAIETTKVAMAKEFLLNKLSPKEAKALCEKKSFGKKDLVSLLRSKYETTIYVPNYRAAALLHKALRLSKEGIFLRPQ